LFAKDKKLENFALIITDGIQPDDNY